MIKTTTTFSSKTKNRFFSSTKYLFIFCFFVVLTCCVLANSSDDDKLIDQFLSSKGKEIICFDSSNIKQFWINNSVVSHNNSIVISLNSSPQSFKSDLLKIQLSNVNSSLDCLVDVFSEEDDLSFEILDSKSTVISKPVSSSDFIQNKIYSSSFHLENAPGFSFFLRFISGSSNSISIKKIVLSFAQSDLYLSSPGTILLSSESISSSSLKESTGNSFSLVGNSPMCTSRKKILVSDNILKASARIKNNGDRATKVFLGYIPYKSNSIRIENRSCLYNSSNTVLTVSSIPENNKLIVNSYPEWQKNCFVVKDAKEDLSDFPNCSFLSGKVVEVNKIDDNKSEIILDSPVQNELEIGSKIRIQSPPGNTYLYTDIKTLQPGEEVILSSTTSKDESFFQFSPNAFSRGVFYVVPLIFSLSEDQGGESNILITDFTISY